MKAVLLSGYCGVDVLRIGECPDPVPERGDLLVRVRATALNRADLLQRRGKYPPPEGASEILGLEMAGEVLQATPAAGDFRQGDRVWRSLSFAVLIKTKNRSDFYSKGNTYLETPNTFKRLYPSVTGQFVF